MVISIGMRLWRLVCWSDLVRDVWPLISSPEDDGSSSGCTERIMLVGLLLLCSWCVVISHTCGELILIGGSATGEVVLLLVLSGCEVAREEPIHSPIAYLFWIWRWLYIDGFYCNQDGLVFS